MNKESFPGIFSRIFLRCSLFPPSKFTDFQNPGRGIDKESIAVQEDLDSLECGGREFVTSGSTQYSSSEPLATQVSNKYKALALEDKKPTPLAEDTQPCTQKNEWWHLATPFCRGKRHPSSSLTCYLQRSVSCQKAPSEMLWKGYQDSSGPLMTIP